MYFQTKSQLIPNQNQYAVAIPNVLLEGSFLLFEGKKIDLGKQNLMIKLFSAFINNENCRVSRINLISLIYGHTDFSNNNRKLLCDFHNIVKLISRARKLCEANLFEGSNPKWVWFDYDPFTSEWVLIKPRHVRMTAVG